MFIIQFSRKSELYNPHCAWFTGKSVISMEEKYGKDMLKQANSNSLPMFPIDPTVYITMDGKSRAENKCQGKALFSAFQAIISHLIP